MLVIGAAVTVALLLCGSIFLARDVRGYVPLLNSVFGWVLIHYPAAPGLTQVLEFVLVLFMSFWAVSWGPLQGRWPLVAFSVVLGAIASWFFIHYSLKSDIALVVLRNGAHLVFTPFVAVFAVSAFPLLFLTVVGSLRRR
jgi:hypothetical protein